MTRRLVTPSTDDTETNFELTKLMTWIFLVFIRVNINRIVDEHLGQ